MILFGTSGFSYKDWVGIFYPRGMPQREWLAHYSCEFDCCEINSTYYALPNPRTMNLMAGKTGAGFTFSVKAHQDMTHIREDNEAVFRDFKRGLEPLLDERKLGCVLAQFPYSFRMNRRNLDYLALFRERLGELPVVIEFRHAGWLIEEVFQWLRTLRMGFCCVDEPSFPGLLPPLAVTTSDVAYVRFDGRNAVKWWQHAQAYERYDYSYSVDELREWWPRIQSLNSAARKTFIFANNHWRAQSVDTIRQLRRFQE